MKSERTAPMLDFKPINIKSAARLRKYYSHCTYRLAEYSLGVKLMWRGYSKNPFSFRVLTVAELR